MQSKNKPSPTAAERDHIRRVKLLPCCVCRAGGGESAPSEAHELRQDLWWTSIPLCASCHRSAFNGIHGQARIWSVKKLDELGALNITVCWLMHPELIQHRCAAEVR